MFRFHALKAQLEPGTWSPVSSELWVDFLEDALTVDGEMVTRIFGDGDYVDLQFEDGFMLAGVFRGHLEQVTTA